jgi:EAL domain-containing protein (putative c-di-GMP-specific phosphodiesterase class I)
MGRFELSSALRDERIAIRYLPRIALRPMPMVVGAVEVLVWNSGDGWSAVPPLSGLPEEGLKQLWRWKLRQLHRAFASVKHLEGAPYAASSLFPVSWAFPLAQLESGEWAFDLLKALDAGGIPGNFIELQLTVRDAPGLPVALEQCALDVVRNAGVVLALRAFPSGASSIVQLAHGKFSKVIVDRSLVPAMHESLTVWARKRDLLAGLVSLAASVGTRVVIDGIGEPGQLNFLEKLPQVEWQGAYWGGPVELGSLLSGVRGRQDPALG